MDKPSESPLQPLPRAGVSSQLYSSSLCPADPRKTSAGLTCPQVCGGCGIGSLQGLVFPTYSEEGRVAGRKPGATEYRGLPNIGELV
jgi:hypothetical protein